MRYVIPVVCLCVIGCSRHRDVSAGTLFSVQVSDSEFRVAKLLVSRDDGVHILLYANTWPRRPDDVRPSELRQSTFDPSDFLSHGYLPLTWRAFDSLAPVEFGKMEIIRGDLYPYGTWNEAMLPYLDGSLSQGFVAQERK